MKEKKEKKEDIEAYKYGVDLLLVARAKDKEEKKK